MAAAARASCPRSPHFEAADVQQRILSFTQVADFRAWYGACSCTRQVTCEFAADVLHSPWWLLDHRGEAAVLQVFSFCSPVNQLRLASTGRSWRRTAARREAWQHLRFSFGWGPDAELRCLLRVLRRFARLHGISEIPDPEVLRPGIPDSRTPCTPPTTPTDQKKIALARAGGFLQSQPTSQLIFRRHAMEEPGQDLCLLEPKAVQSGARQILCRAIAEAPKLLAGCTVLEVDSGAGMVGLTAAALCRTMTLTASDELGCRLLRLNASSSAAKARATRSKSYQAAAVSGAGGRQVPVYVYPLPPSRVGALELARQWQWDSGTAMRSMRPALVAPHFDVLLHAGCAGPEDERVMKKEDRIRLAQKNKDEGNDMFKAQKFDDAVRRYKKAIDHVTRPEVVSNLTPDEAEEAKKIKVSCHLNSAQCYIKAGEAAAQSGGKNAAEPFYKKARTSCEDVLELDASSIKAMFRRSLCQEKLGELEDALKDIKKGLAVSPEDADLKKAQERLQKLLNKQKEGQKKVFSKMFG